MEVLMQEKEEKYERGISDVNIQMEAFGKAMKQVVPSLSSTVRELRSALSELKKEKEQT